MSWSRKVTFTAGVTAASANRTFSWARFKKEKRAGYTIYISSCEYARDLEAPPAMLLDKTIYVRQESVRRFLWEKIEEFHWNRKNEAMQRALACYAFEIDAASALERMTQNETDAMIAHEMGEALVGEQLGRDWQKMLSTLSRSKAEIMVRAVRDILADCMSTLPKLLAADNEASLHFYFANFGGMRKHLFPEAIDAYQRWATRQDGDALYHLANGGARRWLETARTTLDLYQKHGEHAAPAIEKLLEPAAETSHCCSPKSDSSA